MANFRDLLTASDQQLVQLFYRVRPAPDEDFIKKINHTARLFGLNHAQLVCALGFNKHIRDLTDILSVIGFSSYKLLSYRRDELFSTDTYHGLDVDNILDIYTERTEDGELLDTLRGLLAARFDAVERKIDASADAATLMSYKMEIHAVYAGGIATVEFAEARAGAPIGRYRLMTDEIRLIAEEKLVPPSNLFFLDTLLPREKRALLDTGAITDSMIRNRIQNTDISDEERELLEDYL